jgi:excinuclease ABC subunit A
MVKIGGFNISEVAAWPIEQLLPFLARLELGAERNEVAEAILAQARQRLRFMQEVGLGYLTLDRTTMTLSGGEAQRIRLATQVGAALVGVTYILDEPSIGLHQRDNDRLIAALVRLRDLGNTVSSSSTTRTPSAPPTSSSTWAPAPASRAAGSSPPAPCERSAEPPLA